MFYNFAAYLANEQLANDIFRGQMIFDSDHVKTIYAWPSMAVHDDNEGKPLSVPMRRRLQAATLRSRQPILRLFQAATTLCARIEYRQRLRRARLHIVFAPVILREFTDRHLLRALNTLHDKHPLAPGQKKLIGFSVAGAALIGRATGLVTLTQTGTVAGLAVVIYLATRAGPAMLRQRRTALPAVSRPRQSNIRTSHGRYRNPDCHDR